MTNAEDFWNDKLNTAIAIGEIQKFSCKEHKKEILTIIKNLKVIGLEAIKISKEETQLLYLKDSVNAIFDACNNKTNKLHIKMMKEIENRISKKTAKKIFSWIDAKMEEAKNEQVCFDEYFSEDLPKGCESDYDIYKKHFFNKKKEER